MEKAFQFLNTLGEPVIVLLAMVLLLILNKWAFQRIRTSATGANITRGAISFGIVLIGILVFILSLPIDRSTKGQILGFLGIIISAGIALSSTTILGNMIAGLMNNSMNRHRNGDLIKIGDFHGRVIRKSIFHTEIQLEDSNFITIPNLYMANNPVKLTRKSDTVISATVSLGYDVPRSKIEKALKEAAVSAGLTNPYVYITGLGDFSVGYKIHGFLEDSGKFFSTTSQLHAEVMDHLHREKIEIVSPSFMNQRRVDDHVYIPEQLTKEGDKTQERSPEELIFDEAIKSEKIEIKKDYLADIGKKLEQMKEELKSLKDEQEKEKLRSRIKRNEELKKRIEKSIEEQLENRQEKKK